MARTMTSPATRLTLRVAAARELMTPDPIRVRETDALKHAIAHLVDDGIHCLPVVNDEGEPVGVLSASNVLVAGHLDPSVPHYYHHEMATSAMEERLLDEMQIEDVDRRLVRDCMTPVVYSVPPTAPAERVVAELLALEVHQLFVVDSKRSLKGVISAVDLLRALSPRARSTRSGERFVLKAATAAEVMAANPISLNSEALVSEARDLFLAKGFSAAPVINHAGRPVGVLSRTDLIVHERESVDYMPVEEGAPRTDPTTVAEVMTPVVFAVPATMPMAEVIARMLELHVHRLFVLDATESLVGVISVLDVLRHLEAE